MRVQQADGFPLTFNLPDAAAMTGARVPALRTYIARDILNHVGQPPLAGQERRFTVTGLIEVAIIDALSEGLSLKAASRVVDYGLRLAFAKAILAGRVPADRDVRDEDQSTSIFDCNPQYWFWGNEWEYGDLSDPVFWVFAIKDDRVLAFERAFGWRDIERACSDIAKQTFRVLLPTVPPGGPPTEMSSLPQPSDEYIRTAAPHVHLLNLTAILTNIDRAVEQKFTGSN